MRRRALTVLWASFVTAALAEAVFFSWFDPGELALPGGAALSPTAAYSIGFFLFWSLGAMASALTCYLNGAGEDGASS